jgi:hypothetical protein
VLIAAGIGLNFAVNRQWGSKGGGRMDQVAASRNQEALTQTAKAIAEVTDADTGRRLAVRLAAMSGHELSREEEAAINEAVEKRPIHVAPSEKKG